MGKGISQRNHERADFAITELIVIGTAMVAIRENLYIHNLFAASADILKHYRLPRLHSDRAIARRVRGAICQIWFGRKPLQVPTRPAGEAIVSPFAPEGE
jgi:hypothetical protein